MKKAFFFLFLQGTLIPLLFTIPILHADSDPGMGFVFPDGEPLGAGKRKFSIIDVVVGAEYAYGVTDTLDIEIGEIGFLMANFGFRMYTPKIYGVLRFSFDCRMFLFPLNGSEEAAFTGIVTALFERGPVKLSISGGAGAGGETEYGYSADLLLNFRISKHVALMVEGGWLKVGWEDLSHVVGVLGGPRIFTGHIIVDLGLLFPVTRKDGEKWRHRNILPVFNFHYVWR